VLLQDNHQINQNKNTR